MTQSGNKVRDLVLDLWTRTRIDWGFATDRIAETFRRERGLSSRERRQVAETLYGMIRQARRIDFALEGARLGPGPRRELARWWAFRLLEGEIGPGDIDMKEVDWGQVAAVDERIARERDPARRLGLARSLPDWLAARLLAEYGEEADALATALNERAPLTIRVNQLKTTREALTERLAGEGVSVRPTRFASAGLVLETRLNVFGLAAFKEGLFEVQDEASQLVAELVAPPPQSLVVDACAGAGGKTLALGVALAGRGRIVALDTDGRKLVELRGRARRAGLSNVRPVDVALGWTDEVTALVGKADRVLVDAPCSGLGALRRNPEARWRVGEADVTRLAGEQLAIARQALRLVRPGGRLIYATCTILREENQDVVNRLLSEDPALEPVRAAEIWGNERAIHVTDLSGTYLKMLPNRHDTDGFFAAVLRRRQAA